MTNEFKDKMYEEALMRLEMLLVDRAAIDKFRETKVPPKSYANIEDMTVRSLEINKYEQGLIDEFEKKHNALVYYVIKDTGFWPDGFPFPRYSFAYVSSYDNEWEMEKEHSIKLLKTIPAYVINEDESECSEITEFGYENVSGLLVNIT